MINVDKIIEENLGDGIGWNVIDNLEYSINHHVSYHETDYDEGVAECNGDRIGYDPQQWILDFKSSPAHWEFLMDPDMRFIYAAYSHETEDGFTLMIG